MQWHQSPFWRVVAVAALILLATAFVRSGGLSSPARAQQTEAGTGDLASNNRLENLRRIGVVPWDATRGIFLSCDNSGKIHQYNLGSDWETKVNFEILSTEAQGGETQEAEK